MHRAFAEYTAQGQSSGALLETAQTRRAEMPDGLRLGVIRSNGRIIATVKHVHGSDETLHFSRLAVDPDSRGQGLA